MTFQRVGQLNQFETENWAFPAQYCLEMALKVITYEKSMLDTLHEIPRGPWLEPSKHPIWQQLSISRITSGSITGVESTKIFTSLHSSIASTAPFSFCTHSIAHLWFGPSAEKWFCCFPSACFACAWFSVPLEMSMPGKKGCSIMNF